MASHVFLGHFGAVQFGRKTFVFFEKQRIRQEQQRAKKKNDGVQHSGEKRGKVLRAEVEGG